MSRRRDTHRLSKRDQALLVRLADGTLPERARAGAERRVQAIPGADRLIDRQRRAARALGAGWARPADAPANGRIPAARAGDQPARRGWARLPRVAIGGAFAAALAGVLVVLALVIPSNDTPTVARVADLAKQPATQKAPAEDGPVLRASVDGVRFPDWAREFGWKETGMRHDELAGRQTTTVFYEHTTHRLAYTIVAGPPLEPPSGARIVRREGLEIALYRDPGHGGHDIAVFERGGHTCVVAGHVMKLSTLIELAAWRGGGSVRS